MSTCDGNSDVLEMESLCSNKVINAVQWSDKFGAKYSIAELCGLDDWPLAIKPETGWFGEDETLSFAAEEPLVALGVQHFTRLTACPFDEKLGDTPGAILKNAKPEYVIPLSLTNEYFPARVKILPIKPIDHIYPLVKDLYAVAPKYVKPTINVSVGKTKYQKGSVVEFKTLCQTPGMNLSCRGFFHVVPDEKKYTLLEIYENFSLPQRVVFIGLPNGLAHNDLFLLDVCTLEVLVATPLRGLLYKSPEPEPRLFDPRTNFIYLPKPTVADHELREVYFYFWTNRDSPECKEIMKRAQEYVMDGFRDVNVVLPASAASEVQSLAADEAYAYILDGKVVDELPTPAKTPDAPTLAPRSKDMPEPSCEDTATDNTYHKGSLGRKLNFAKIRTQVKGALNVRRKSEGGGKNGSNDKPFRRSKSESTESVSETDSKPAGRRRHGDGPVPAIPLPAPDEAESNSRYAPEPRRVPNQPAAGEERKPTPPPTESIPTKQFALNDLNKPAVLPKPHHNIPVVQTRFSDQKALPRKRDLPPIPGTTNHAMDSTNGPRTARPGGPTAKTQSKLSNLSIKDLKQVVCDYGLDDLARKLETTKTDGAMFVSLSAEVFRGRPFHASDFEIIQIERIKSEFCE